MNQLKLEEYVANEVELKEKLSDTDNWSQIPLLNHTPSHELCDGRLVRFRGMIQDMLDNETYLEEYEVLTDKGNGTKRTQNGKYRDCFVLAEGEVVDHNGDKNSFGERRTVFVVSVPGLNDWAVSYENEANCKRNEEVFESMNSGQKRPLDETDEGMDVDSSVPEIATSKKICTYGSAPPKAHNSSTLSSEYLLNSPISERPSKACLVKIYSDFDSHHLNALVDVVGFLSVNPAMDATTCDESEDPYMDMDAVVAANPPPSLIPRLHAIAIRPMTHLNPMLDATLAAVDSSTSNVEALYKDILIILTQCLFGDTLAAEYLLAHLISTVYVRTELETLGQFALNICNIPGPALPEYTKKLYEFIESLLPASHYLPMTLENMNTLQFVPKKDYKTNKLTSGILQLAPHTHLVLDETRMQTGKLETNGVLAVQNLSHLIKTQSIKCDFQYYNLDYHANISVLVLSEGRSMLPSNSQIPLHADPECVALIEETLKAGKHYLQPKLNALRKYLTNAKITKFEMNPLDEKMIENDFVEMRKENKNVGAEELHSLLVLSRLLGIARGRAVLDKEMWELAKSFEKQRRARLDSLPRRRV